MTDNAKVLRKQIEKRRVKVEEGTVVLFDSLNERTGVTYTYAALYIADAWWLTGVADWFGRKVPNESFLSLVADGKITNVRVATEFEAVK